MSDARGGTVAELVRQLASGDAEQRATAAERLCQAGPDAVAAAVPLVEACRDDDDRVREWAVAALEELGAPPMEAIERLKKLVGDPVPLAGYWAATLLGRCGEDAAAAVAALAAGVDSGADLSVRQRAAWALGQIGPAASAARGVLENAAGDGDVRLARLAAEALEAIGT